VPDGVLLWQVACEFLFASRKLSKQGFTPTAAWNRVAEFRDLLPLVPRPRPVWRAQRISILGEERRTGMPSFSRRVLNRR